VTGSIEIDPEALERASRDLADAAGRLTGAASDAGGVRLSPQAFGSMNSYLGGPISLAARRTTELLRATGDVVGALGVAAQAAADDFTEYESGVSDGLTEAAADLAGQQGIL
jgi:hypothetical protein